MFFVAKLSFQGESIQYFLPFLNFSIFFVKKYLSKGKLIDNIFNCQRLRAEQKLGG